MVEIRVNTSYFLWQLYKININNVHNTVGTTVVTCHKLTGGLALRNSYGLMSYIVYSDIGLFHILYTVFYSIQHTLQTTYNSIQEFHSNVIYTLQNKLFHVLMSGFLKLIPSVYCANQIRSAMECQRISTCVEDHLLGNWLVPQFFDLVTTDITVMVKRWMIIYIYIYMAINPKKSQVLRITHCFWIPMLGWMTSSYAQQPCGIFCGQQPTVLQAISRW